MTGQSLRILLGSPEDGMVIYTNTPRLQHHRKMIIELLLAAHCRDCTTCAKNGVCTLQKLSRQLGITKVRFENNKNSSRWILRQNVSSGIRINVSSAATV